MAQRSDQFHHDRMVRKAADFLRDKGMQVQADVTSYPRPGIIRWQGRSTGGHIPDVLTSAHVVEVETADSIDSEHTNDQWRLFAAYASANRLEFWVGAPVGARIPAQNKLTQLGFSGQVWEL